MMGLKSNARMQKQKTMMATEQMVYATPIQELCTIEDLSHSMLRCQTSHSLEAINPGEPVKREANIINMIYLDGLKEAKDQGGAQTARTTISKRMGVHTEFGTAAQNADKSKSRSRSSMRKRWGTSNWMKTD